ncbi:uncharacterized protein LOC116621578 [Nematostella vectensis]|uniref:uncharacterized protein LOC116621578 n=1 Tax=Nematostella vectensis TaxID=45351 RepID=UPI002077103C|nr:uncharacterized protein LOC116621578 [Nematostella vectensis]
MENVSSSDGEKLAVAESNQVSSVKKQQVASAWVETEASLLIAKDDDQISGESTDAWEGLCNKKSDATAVKLESTEVAAFGEEVQSFLENETLCVSIKPDSEGDNEEHTNGNNNAETVEHKNADMACSQPELTKAEDKSISKREPEVTVNAINMEKQLEEDEPIDEEEEFAKTMEAMACFVFFQGRSMEEIRQAEVELGPLWPIVVAFREKVPEDHPMRNQFKE